MRRYLIVLALTILAGCGGGLNCPVDPPSCCYNQLFGCGTFDLPFGCECSAYGLGSATLAASKQHKILAATPAYSVSGRWAGKLLEESSSCAGTLPFVSGVAQVRERAGKVRVGISGYGTLRGSMRGRRGFSATGIYELALTSCEAHIALNLKASGVATGDVVANMELYCGSVPICEAQYRGTVKKKP